VRFSLLVKKRGANFSSFSLDHPMFLFLHSQKCLIDLFAVISLRLPPLHSASPYHVSVSPSNGPTDRPAGLSKEKKEGRTWKEERKRISKETQRKNKKGACGHTHPPVKLSNCPLFPCFLSFLSILLCKKKDGSQRRESKRQRKKTKDPTDQTKRLRRRMQTSETRSLIPAMKKKAERE